MHHMQRRTFLIALSATALSACATLPAADTPVAPTEEAAWFALGTEPFWNVEITPQHINYHDADGRQIRVATPRVTHHAGARRYVTDQISVEITPGTCSDGMSDRKYADTVQVVAGGRTLSGCGGRVLPPTHLDGTNWRIVSIGGVALPSEGARAPFMRFEGNRVSASTGCNTMTGNFTSDGTRLTVSQMISTMMACVGPAGEQEARLGQLLRQSLSIRYTAREQMILTGNDNVEIILQRSH